MSRGLLLDLPGLEARLARFDAKVAAAREQLGFDFSAVAAAPAGGGGKGSGKPCGEGHIAAPLTCHKGSGGPSTGPVLNASVAVPREGARSLDETSSSGSNSWLDMKARIGQGRDGFEESIKELGGLSDEDAALVADYYLIPKNKGGLGVATLSPHIGRAQVKHGAFLDKPVIARALAQLKEKQAQAAEPERFGAKPKPKKKEEELMASDEVKTSADQVRFAKQQRAAAYRAGDKKGEKAWEELQRDVQRRRLAAAMEAKQQTQTGLFGVTEFDETMPLFGRKDAADPVARLLSATFGESLPGAAVLNWDRHPRGLIAGRLAAEGLVYRFSCDSTSIAYRPAWDGLDESGWEARSEGFLMARSPGTRQDFRFEQKKSKKQCSKGYGCGSSCITLSKECRITPSSAISKQRLRQLQVLAKEGDTHAEGLAKKVAEGRSQKAGELVEGRQIGKLKKMLEDPRVAEMIRTGKVPTAEEGDTGNLAGKVKVVAPGEIQVDPERFQYKINANAFGEVGSLKGVKKWDDNLAGVISVWQDPADGKTYVVNGHNRLGLATRMGVEGVTVRYLKAANAKEARAIGAMQNIAEGQGTEIDAAKFFRDTGIRDQKGVEEKGLPLSSGKAGKGLGLARLPDEMFREVVNGTLSPARGAIIGNSGLDEAKQREIGKMLRSRKSVSDGTLQEYVEALAVSQRQKQGTLDIFGAGEETVDDGLARAELVNSIARKIAKEKRLFGMVSQSKAAATLAEKAGNVINKEESAGVASEADQLGRMFKDMKNVSGPMSDAINAAAARVTAGERREVVQRELYEGIVEAMQKELEQFGLGGSKPSSEAPTASLFDSIEARLDAAKKCIKGMACGNSCVPKGSKCRSKAAPAAAGRLQQLQAAAGQEAPAAVAPGAAKGKTKGKRKRKSKAAPNAPVKKASTSPEAGFEATVAAAGKALAKAVMEGPGEGKPAAAPAKEAGQWDWKPDHDQTNADGWFSKQFTAQLAKPVKINGDDAEAVTFQIQGEPATYGESQKRRLKAAGFDPPEGKKAIEFTFGTGYDGYIESGGVDRMEISDPKVSRRLALAISRQMKEVVAGLPDGTIVAAGYHKADGAGEARRKLYEQAGFAFYEQDADSYDPNGFAVVQGGKLQRFPTGRKDSELENGEIDLDALMAQLLEVGGGDRADRFDAIFERIARLDAKAKASDPGQLDLFGGGGGSGGGKAPAAGGAGDGKGKPCGESFISGGFTCRKGGSGPLADNPPMASGAERARELRQQREGRNAEAIATRSPRPVQPDAAQEGINAEIRRIQGLQEDHTNNANRTGHHPSTVGHEVVKGLLSYRPGEDLSWTIYGQTRHIPAEELKGLDARGVTAAIYKRVDEPGKAFADWFRTPAQEEARRAARVAAQEKSIKEVAAERQRQTTKGADPNEIPITEKDLEGIEQAKEIMAGRLSPKAQLEKWKAEGLVTAPPAAEPKKFASPEDLDGRLAADAHRGTSFDPEKRGRSHQEDFAKHLNSVYEGMSGMATTPEQKAIFEQEMGAYRDGYKARYTAWLGAKSRIMSPMISGPARFPASRMERANATEHKRLQELLDFTKKGQQRLSRKLAEARDPSEVAAEDAAMTAKMISRSLGNIAAIDRGDEGFRGFDRRAFASNLAGRIARMANRGEVEAVQKALDQINVEQRGMKKPAFTPRHSIWELASDADRARRKAAQGPTGSTTQADHKSGEIERDFDGNRVRLRFHDGKPSESLRRLLKGSGWKWSPTNSAWQRMNTENSLYSAKSILSAADAEKEQAARGDSLDLLEARLDAFSDMPAIEAGARNLEGLRGSGGRMPTRAGLIKQERTQEQRQYKINAHLKPKAATGTGKPCGQSFIPALAECHASRGPNQLGARLRAHFPGLEIKMEQKGGELRIHQLKARGPAPGLMDALKRYAAGKGLKLAIRTNAEAS